MLDLLLFLTNKSFYIAFFMIHVLSVVALIFSGTLIMEDAKGAYKNCCRSFKIYYITGCILLCWVPVLNIILCVSSFLYLNKLAGEK